MSELTEKFWAKLDQRDGRIVGWHPVVDHCADVAATCQALLARTLLRRRLAALGGLDDLSPGQVARLGVLAALHDLGKFNLGFQNKRHPRPPFTAGHVGEALAVLFCRRRYACGDRAWEVLPGDELAAWGDEEGICQLLVATIGHHGRPVAVPPQLDERLWRPTGHLDPFAGLANLVLACRKWFPEAWTREAEPLPTNAAFQHAWSGLVMLGDWLGSDARRFPLSNGCGSLVPQRADRAKDKSGTHQSDIDHVTRDCKGDERRGAPFVQEPPGLSDRLMKRSDINDTE